VAHTHDHHHDHDHGEFSELSDIELRVRSLESLLTEKGFVDSAALDALVQYHEEKIGPRNGAQVVAKAWSDPEFKEWLLREPTEAISSVGFEGRQGEDMVVIENSPDVHNVVVCTLCSCYPWPVLGLPPVWYKSAPYRSRVVSEPRSVLADFGTELDAGVEIRVWDSTAELRYLVLPMRPDGTEDWSEEQLAGIVTRNSMIGTEVVASP